MVSSIRNRLVLLLLAALACVATPAGASTAQGWQKLWANDHAGARTLLRTALKTNPGDTAAMRGLGLLSLQEDARVPALQAWKPLYTSAAGHWSALGYWPFMAALAEETGRWGLLEEAGRGILASRAAPPELRASARMVLADAADRAGKPAEADKLWAALGYVRKWQVIGPFDNVSRSGFEKVFPPEREIDFSRGCPGKDDLPRNWYRLALVRRDGQCMVSESLGDGMPNVFYAATALQSERDQAVLLRLDPTGATKVWVNGQLLFSDDKYRESGWAMADPFAVPATLRKGWNTLLVKVADDEDGSAQFALRVTPPGSELPVSLAVDPARAAGRAEPAAPGRSPGPAENAWVVRLRKAAPAGDLEAAWALSGLLRHACDYTAAAQALRAAVERVPDCGWLHWELSQAFFADRQDDEGRVERDFASKHNPRIIEAELDALEEQQEELAPAEAIRRLKSLLKVSPTSASVQWALSEAYYDAEMEAESLQAARAALAGAAGPENTMRLIRTYRMHGRKADAERLLAEALKATPHWQDFLVERAMQLAQQNKPAEAIAAYERVLANNPAAARCRATIAHLYRGMRNLKKAAEALQGCRARFPQDAGICTDLADLLREMGRAHEAIPLYRTAIALQPSRVSLRDKLQVLTGEKPVVDLVPPLPADAVLRSLPKTPDTPGASASVLLDDGRMVVYPDYATISRCRQIIKVFDKAGVQLHQEFELPVYDTHSFGTVESARLIKADGKVQRIDADGESGGVSFPSLAPGDTIDVSYRVEGWSGGGLARQFWSMWGFSGMFESMRLSRFALITPAAMAFRTQAHGPVPEPAVRDVKEWRVREWRMENQPPVKAETHGVPGREAVTWLDISSVPSWAHIVRWYRDLSEPRCVPDEAVKAKALELTRDARNEDEKIRALFRYVASEIQYQSTPFRLSAFVPTEGKQVLRERYGDCKDKAALLTAMLAAVGIRADMALVSGRDDGILPWLPSPRFNHAICRVRSAKGPLWLDPTADEMAFGCFPVEGQGVPALIIDAATTELTTTPVLPADGDRVEGNQRCVLGVDGKLKGTIEFASSGNWGWVARSATRQVPEAQYDEFFRRLAALMVENAQADKGTIADLDAIDKPLVMRIDYHVDRYSNEAGDFLLVPVPWAVRANSCIDGLVDEAKRERDLEITGTRGAYVSTVSIELPAGYAVHELKPEMRGECPYGSYRITLRAEGNTLHARHDLRITGLRVPAKDVPAFVEFFRAMERDTRKPLLLKKQ